MRGRRVESVTIGSQPGRQIIIYDKRREAIERQKYFWFDVWGKDRHDKNLEVWRVEVRAGKRELKNKYQLSTIEDFDTFIGDVITNTLSDIRYHSDHQGDSNVSRQALSPLWQAAQETAALNLSDLRAGLTPGQVKEIERSVAQDTYLSLCTGNAIGLSVSKGLSDEEIEGLLPELIGEAIAQHFQASGEGLYASIKRSRDRLAFLD